MESIISVAETSTSNSASSLLDIPKNEHYLFNEDVATDLADVMSSPVFDNFTRAVTMTVASLNLGPVRDPLYIVIPITISYALIFITGLVGNVVTCIVIARNKHMHTATNYYLFSLAVSDLLLLVSGLPPEIYCIWSRYPYVFGEVFCVLRGLAAETSANATVLTITAFTVERYVAICHPFLSHTMSKLSRAIKLILVIWIVALAFAVPQAFQFGIVVGDTPESATCTFKNVIIAHSFELSTFLFFVLPMTLITVLYALIGLRLRRSNMMKKDSGSFSCRHFCSSCTTASLQQPAQRNVGNGNGRRPNCCRHHQSHCSRRVLKMLVAVVVAFFICWAPFHAQRLFAIYSKQQQTPVMLHIYEIMTYISGILYYVSTTINPILYHTMSLKFREAFKDTLARCCRYRGIKAHGTRRSYSIISRSAQRGSLGASNAGQESTDYSGNSVREEVLPNGGGSVKESSGSRRSHRKQDSGHHTDSRCHGTNRVTSPNDQRNADSDCRRYCSVVISTAQVSQQPTVMTTSTRLNTKTKLKEKGNDEKGKKKKKNSWNVFRSTLSSASIVEETKKLSVSYSMRPAAASQHVVTLETLEMLEGTSDSVQSLASSSNTVSNSSLRDVERGALEDELTAYMRELRCRDEC